ncbi:MAG: hypothetical protein ACI89X_002626 [Planctomycetota bacterium]|jgi:hypothetical protein
MNNALTRLWRIPLRYAFWLAMPLQIIMIWVAHRGWVQYDRAMIFAAPTANRDERLANFNLERWRYFTKKELQRSFHRTTAPVLAADDLETIHLHIDGRHLGSLNSNLPESGKTKFYPAILTVDGRAEHIKTRYMGDNHWHWLYPQKSWKVKTKSGNPIQNRRIFNLKNPPTIGIFEDEIANELAAQIGLISPKVSPLKMFINGAYAGVYLWWDIADESMLRRYRRMPGSIYSGDGAPIGKDGISSLFSDEKFWKKDSARNAERAADRSDIQMLIHAINDPDPASFRAFADDHLSLPQYGRFTALDRLFGGQHHDYAHNHKLYFDPYKGKFEPIEWDFAFWQSGGRAAGLDQALNPLLLRVRQHPEYELQILRELFDLTKKVSPDSIKQRVLKTRDRIRNAFEADGFRDARLSSESNKLRLPREHCAYYSDDKWLSYIDRHIESFKWRYNWLGRRLAESQLTLHVSPQLGNVTVLRLQSSGLVGQNLDEVAATTSAASVELIEDRNRNGKFDPSDRVLRKANAVDGTATFQLNEQLLPGLKKAPRKLDFVKMYGREQLLPTALDYGYLLRTNSGEITKVTATEWVAAESCWSYHPWELPPAAAPRTIELGPGEILLGSDLNFGPETTVVVHPGTIVKMAGNVSIEFRGKVLAEGRADAPIRFEAQDPNRPWGVIALHGQGTRGSRFDHCQWRDGSTAELRAVARTGMVSIIDTNDLRMANCYIGRNFVGDDALHWGYLTNAQICDSEFEGARSDAFDIDISKDIKILRCHFKNSGNDSIDLMTSTVQISDCVFDDAGDKGVSVGEGSELQLLDSRLNRCFIGIEIKDGSSATVDNATKLDGCTTGVNLYRKNPRYSEGGTLVADQLSIVGSTQAVTKDKKSTVKIDQLVTTASQE